MDEDEADADIDMDDDETGADSDDVEIDPNTEESDLEVDAEVDEDEVGPEDHVGPLPDHFPVLPIARHLVPAGVVEAYERLKEVYTRALEVSRLNEANSARIVAAIEQIEGVAEPHMQAMMAGGEIEMGWIESVAGLFRTLRRRLGHVRDLSAAVAQALRTPDQLVRLEHTGRRGKPAKVIDEAFLRLVTAPRCRLSKAAICRVLGVAPRTLEKNLDRYGLSKEYTDLTPEQLQAEIQQFRSERPSQGYRMLEGYLLSKGIKLRITEIKASLPPLDRAQRQLNAKYVRKQYYAEAYNDVWHMDGHHKLIRWKIVIHAVIDGMSRTITGMKAVNNNRAPTVFEMVRAAIDECGMPSRIRGDRGGENRDVARYMIMVNGPKRGSFLWGKSTSNTPIERLWGSLGEQMLRRWKAFLLRLEKLHGLDIEEEWHTWLIHCLFIGPLNEELQGFRTHWNNHGVSSHRMGNKSPNDMRILSIAQHGRRPPHSQDAIREVLRIYYGNEVPPGIDLDLDALDDLVLQLDTDQNGSVRHAGVRCEAPRCPFDDEVQMTYFLEELSQAIDTGYIPAGYKVSDAEIGPRGYPDSFSLSIGGRGGRQDVQLLPREIWFPRALSWARGCYAVERTLAHFSLLNPAV